MLKSRHFWVGLALFLLIISPLIVRNILVFNDPSLSYYYNLMVTLGYGENAYHDHYQVFWEGPPSLRNLMAQHGFSGIVHKAGQIFLQVFYGNYYFSYQPGLVSLMFSGALLAAAVLGLFFCLKNRLARITILILMVTMTFSCFCFAYQYRYYLLSTSLLFLFVFQWLFPNPGSGRKAVGAAALTKQVATGKKPVQMVSFIIASVFLLFLFLTQTWPYLVGFEDPTRGSFPQQENHFMMACMEMVKLQTVKNERIFTSVPAAVTFHTGRPAVIVPYGDVGQMLQIARLYNVHYYLDTVGRACYILKSYPEFKLIDRFQNPFQRGDLYFLDYTEQSLFNDNRHRTPNRFMFPSGKARGKKEMG
ncbi:hypothetical protein ACFL27_27265 [candidate division CSSED10-310 bacterium]|uniref:Glycosyltransferase RgtA/B/C/D-like domain-containing protein n=1 Tax=candidate division CSSED10-310 bacterium TaxID=2855610 RepID=A0ABV6Z622_UNCC1